MGRVRYAKSLRDLERARASREDLAGGTLRQLRVVYETDSEVAQAVVPRPLEATAEPRVHVSFSEASFELTPDRTATFCTASFGVAVHYDGRDAIYPLTMPMTDEAVATEGRERFGQPTKTARVEIRAGSEGAQASVERWGVQYLRTQGDFAEELGARDEVEELYCFKAFAGCQPSKGFDQDPQLVRIETRYRWERVVRLKGGLELFESAYDPVADLPVRKIASLEYSEGTYLSGGRVLRPVPGDWLLPFLHQRIDDPEIDGLDV